MDTTQPAALVALGALQLQRGAFIESERSFAGYLQLTGDQSWAHREIGFACLEVGADLRAAQAFICALEIDPDDQEAMCNAGLTLVYCGQFTRALPFLLQALPHVLSGALSKVHSALGRSYAALGRPEEAIASFAQVATCSPHDVSWRDQACTCLLDVGAIAETRVHWLVACDLEPNIGHWPMQVGLTYLLEKNAPSAKLWLARAQGLSGSSHRLEYYQAEALFIAGDYAEAALAFTTAANSGSQHRSRSLQQLLRVKVICNEMADAITLGQAACAEYPQEVQFYCLLACAHVKDGNARAAVAVLSEGLHQVDMADEALWRLMHAASVCSGGIQLSTSRLQWLLDRDPGNVDLIEDLGLRAAEDEDDVALESLGYRALALQPENETAMALVATSLRLRGHIDKMVQFLYRHNAHRTRNSTLLGNLGRGLLMLGRLSEAQWMLEEALAVDPRSRVAQGNLYELLGAFIQNSADD